MIYVNGENMKLDKFPDGTLLMKFAMKGTLLEIKWIYESDSELFALICITKHLRRLNPNAEIILFVPYLPNARMDRVKDDCDVFTLKYFAEVINSLSFNKVKVLDVHSSVSEYAINNIEVLSPKPFIEKSLEHIKLLGETVSTVFFVDEGGQKRYSNMIGFPSVYGHKKRDWQSGKILGVEIIGEESYIKDKNIFIVDDIIAYGGSIYYSALRLKELGCKNLYVYASHIENSILDEDKGKLISSGLIKGFFTTESIFTKSHPLIQVL